jgi:hypothetical protein
MRYVPKNLILMISIAMREAINAMNTLKAFTLKSSSGLMAFLIPTKTMNPE